MVGWDISKFLKLARNGNPSVFAWLSSPIVYTSDDYLFNSMKSFLPQNCYSPKASAFHYLGIAGSEIKKLQLADEMNDKKIIYMLRAIASCRWSLNEDSVPPIDVDDLAKILPEKLQEKLIELACRRKEGFGNPIPYDEELISESLKLIDEMEIEARNLPNTVKVSWDVLDEIFRTSIKAYRK